MVGGGGWSVGVGCVPHMNVMCMQKNQIRENFIFTSLKWHVCDMCDALNKLYKVWRLCLPAPPPHPLPPY